MRTLSIRTKGTQEMYQKALKKQNCTQRRINIIDSNYIDINNFHGFSGPVQVIGLNILDLTDHVHTARYTTEEGVFVIKPRASAHGDEELGAILIWT